MPNHITNCLRIENESKAAEVFEHLQSDDRLVDFEEVLPKPEALSAENSEFYHGPVVAAKQVVGEKGPFHNELPIDKDWKHFDQFIAALRNLHETGYAYWYDWNCDHWGTKWNAYSFEDNRNSETERWFETAWSAPFPVTKKISDEFPAVTIEHRWADEDLGRNCGVRVYRNGRIVDETTFENFSNEAMEFAFSLRYPDHEPAEMGYDEGWEYDDDLYLEHNPIES